MKMERHHALAAQQGLLTLQTVSCAIATGVPSYVPGQWVDALDTVSQWLEARVLAVRGDDLLITYSGWSSRWDEWLPQSSPRLAPFRTRTAHVTGAWAASALPVCLPPQQLQQPAGAAAGHGAEDCSARALLPSAVAWMATLQGMLTRLQDLACQQPQAAAARHAAALVAGEEREEGGGKVGEEGSGSGSGGGGGGGGACSSASSAESGKEELAALALQLAPLLDRFGRVLVDLAPGVKGLAKAPEPVGEGGAHGCECCGSGSASLAPSALAAAAAAPAPAHSAEGAQEALLPPPPLLPASQAVQQQQHVEVVSPLCLPVQPPLLPSPLHLALAPSGGYALTPALQAAEALGQCALTHTARSDVTWRLVRLPGYGMETQDGSVSLLHSAHAHGSGASDSGSGGGGGGGSGGLLSPASVVSLLEGVLRLELAAVAQAASAAAAATGLGGGATEDPPACSPAGGAGGAAALLPEIDPDHQSESLADSTEIRANDEESGEWEGFSDSDDEEEH